MTIQTGIDGLRLIADRTKKYSPGREPIFERDEKLGLVSCTAFVKKQTEDGTWHEVASKVYFNEYNQKNGLWPTKPYTMLAKVAESHALRKAFPSEMCGLYTDDEMPPAPEVESKIIEIHQEPVKPSKPSFSPNEKMTPPQINHIHHLLAERGVSYQKIQDMWALPKLEELNQSTGKELFQRIKEEWEPVAK